MRLLVYVIVSVLLMVIGMAWLWSELLTPSFILSTPSITHTPLVSTSTTSIPNTRDVIRGHLSRVDPEVRVAAISMLYSYVNKSIVVGRETLRVSSSSRNYLKFDYVYPFIYELTVSVSGSCVGVCDIKVSLLDRDLRTVRYLGRVSYLRENLTVLIAREALSLTSVGVYYLEFDNSYSLFTSKTVYATIRAYVPVEYVLNDKMYKIVAIANWVSENIKYVSDPYGLEYPADPRETLKARAGDCEDFAVLLASLYRAVGLRSAVGLIDTNGDYRADHATALVAVERWELGELKNALGRYSLLFGYSSWRCVSYFERDQLVWIIVDPPMTYGTKTPWCVDHTPYYLIEVIEP
ncbi:MAG: transglutaminase domain-containing protein [Sulfolobales archaeon]